MWLKQNLAQLSKLLQRFALFCRLLALQVFLLLPSNWRLTYATKSFVRPDGEKAGLKLAKQLYEDGFFGKKISPVKVAIVSGRQPGISGGTDTIRVRTLE